MDTPKSPTQAGLIIKAFAIIKLLSTHKEMSLKDIGLQTNMSSTMAYKCLSTLCDLGYAHQNPKTQQYGLTLRLASICSDILLHYNITELAFPIMQTLGDKVKETVHLAIRDHTDCIYIHKIDSHHSLRLYSQVGKLAPLHCTGLGKVLLAYENDDLIDSIIKEITLFKFTEHTITSTEEFKKHLLLVKEQGYAEDNEEHEFHIRCVAVPIFDYQSHICAALSISMPIARWSEELHVFHIKELLASAQEISHLMGSVNTH
jgi:IclR family KDG regulon transcriptional repressor